jgi:hypothetical protein
MQLILLGGNSKRNQAWIHDVDSRLKPLFKKTAVLEYTHWETGAPMIDLDHELPKLESLANIFGTEYGIFAKSAGSLLTVRGIFEKKLAPKFCIFTGVALLWGREAGFSPDAWLKNYSTPTVFIQKKSDPAAPAEILKHALEQAGAKNYRFLAIEGNNHDYEDLDLIHRETDEFLKSLAV